MPRLHAKWMHMDYTSAGSILSFGHTCQHPLGAHMVNSEVQTDSTHNIIYVFLNIIRTHGTAGILMFDRLFIFLLAL